RDFDADYPQAGRDFKEAVESVDAIMFVTPEYSRTMPAALKNALEWGGRPWGTNSFAGKPAAVIGMSPGGAGTSMAQQHLRNVLAHLDMPTMGQPEAFVQFNQDAWVEGEAVQEGLRGVLGSFMTAFARHIERVCAADLAVANA
ncbi:MAG: NADPH-dependent FMN reductase, partial [bacterium]|nr:NADPH-dependent FMN reductase [bacterium]